MPFLFVKVYVYIYMCFVSTHIYIYMCLYFWFSSLSTEFTIHPCCSVYTICFFYSLLSTAWRASNTLCVACPTWMATQGATNAHVPTTPSFSLDFLRQEQRHLFVTSFPLLLDCEAMRADLLTYIQSTQWFPSKHSPWLPRQLVTSAQAKPPVALVPRKSD